MQTAKVSTFDRDDFTGEGRSPWPVALDKDVRAEEDDTYYSSEGSQSLLPAFFTVGPEDIRDSTPPAISLGSRFAFQSWYKPHGKYIQDLLDEKKDILPNDYSNEDPIQIKIETKHAEESKQQLFDHLYEVYRECCEVNWDGYDATAISKSTYFEAIKLIELIPSFLPEPEIIPEPTGAIAFEWYKGKRFVFVISVGGENIITYAGLFGKNSKTHGTEYFADNLPFVIIENIQRLLL